MRIAGKHVKGKVDHVADPEDGQLLMFDATEDMWIAIDGNDIPVSADGVTATTLGAALEEIMAATGS